MATKSKDDRAILRDLVWRHTHRDFKSTTGGGHRTILINRPAHGTCLEPLDSLSIEDLIGKLPRAELVKWRIDGWHRIAVDRGRAETWRTATAGEDGRWGFVTQREDGGWTVAIGTSSSDDDPAYAGYIRASDTARDDAMHAALCIISPKSHAPRPIAQSAQ